MDTGRFIVIWQESQSLDEVAEKTGMSKTSASSRASALRRLDVALKFFPRGRFRDGNIEEFRRLAREFAK